MKFKFCSVMPLLLILILLPTASAQVATDREPATEELPKVGPIFEDGMAQEVPAFKDDS